MNLPKQFNWIADILFKPLEWIAGIPQDKNKHWRWFGLLWFLVSSACTFWFVVPVCVSIGWSITVLGAGGLEIVQWYFNGHQDVFWVKWINRTFKFNPVHDPSWDDFWWSVTLPTIVTFGILVYYWMV